MYESIKMELRMQAENTIKCICQYFIISVRTLTTYNSLPSSLETKYQNKERRRRRRRNLIPTLLSLLPQVSLLIRPYLIKLSHVIDIQAH